MLGTRPEAIKLAPVLSELRRHADVKTHVCLTGQHREMVQPILELYNVRPDIDLALMTPDQRLPSLTAAALTRIEKVVASTSPDWVMLQGDTTSAMATAMAAFYRQVPVAHVEAGLRTHDLARPFPEEGNRRIVGAFATVHFAPTELARHNLLREGVDSSVIHVTGNMVADALLTVGGLPADPQAGMACLRIGASYCCRRTAARASDPVFEMSTMQSARLPTPFQTFNSFTRCI